MLYSVPTVVASILIAFVAATVLASLIWRLGFPLPLGEGRMGCIDGVRGYLALSVIAHHFLIWTQVVRTDAMWAEPAVPLFNQLGAGAVGLFFMTTGFVFYRRILAGFRNTSWIAVYITRVFRLMPLLIVSVAAVAAIAMTRTGTPLSRNDLPALARWVTTRGEPGFAGDPDAGRINAYVLWSLHFEWLFYIFVLPGSAALMDVFRDRWPSWCVPAILLVIAVAGSLLPVKIPLLQYLPLFALGMLAYEARIRADLAEWLRSRTAALIAAAGLLLAATTFSSPLSPGLPAFAFFFICAACGNNFFGVLSTRGALVLGEASFSLYLLHGILLSLFFVEGSSITKNLSASAALAFLPIISVVAVLVACVTYLGIERPAMRLGSRLASRWTQRRVRSRSPEVEVAP